MRIRLLALPIVGAAMFFGAVSAAGAVPGSSYQWQQPGCAPVYTPCTQPDLSFASEPMTGLEYTASSKYLWTQAGTAPVSPPDAQPW